MLAGTPLTLHCDYTLSTSVDISVETVVTWMMNGSTVATSGESAYLTFSLLTTSDTGRYTCTLAITAPQTPFVTVESLKESPEKVITAQSE